MAKAKAKDGKDLMITIGGKTIALATSCSVSLNRAMNSAASKDDGAWDAPVAGDMSWSVSSSSLFAYDADDLNNQVAFDSLFDAWSKGTLVEVMFGMVEEAAGIPDDGWKLQAGAYGGQAYVASITQNADKGTAATMSVELTGFGEYKKVTA